MLPWIFLGVTTIGLLMSVSTLIAARRIGPLMPVYFLVGWLTGELVWHHLAWQAAATLVFAAAGALDGWPGVLGLGITFVSWGLLLFSTRVAMGSATSVQRAFAESHIEPETEVEHGRFVNPFGYKRAGVQRVAHVEYGPSLEGDKGGRNLLDIISPREPGERRPILLQIHGGGWTIGDKEQQAQPLMAQLAERGWVCFAVNYRLSPQAAFPAHIVDVKRAIQWIREHAEEYGGDPGFICVTGGSAGGHLAALTALSQNDPAYQPGFEDADTSVSACVPFYGVYDFLDREGIRGRHSMTPFLEKTVFKVSPDEAPELWEAASPISRVSSDAPPFLVIHGTHDSLVFVEEAQSFVKALREKSQAPVYYLEMEGAQHAFDTFHSLRSAHAVHAVTAFLEDVRAQQEEASA